jgi:carbonic anhydrase
LQSTRGNNPEFNDIVDGLEDVVEEGSETKIGGQAMHWLEAYEDMQNYYTYSGSLTTPPCSEIVTWIVMKEQGIIGQRQV